MTYCALNLWSCLLAKYFKEMIGVQLQQKVTYFFSSLFCRSSLSYLLNISTTWNNNINKKGYCRYPGNAKIMHDFKSLQTETKSECQNIATVSEFEHRCDNNFNAMMLWYGHIWLHDSQVIHMLSSSKDCTLRFYRQFGWQSLRIVSKKQTWNSDHSTKIQFFEHKCNKIRKDNDLRKINSHQKTHNNLFLRWQNVRETTSKFYQVWTKTYFASFFV